MPKILAKHAANISLLDVYETVEDTALLNRDATYKAAKSSRVLAVPFFNPLYVKRNTS